MKDSLIYGVYAAAGTIVLTLIEYAVGIDKSPVAQYLAWMPVIFIGVAIYMGLKVRRETTGELTYGQGLGTGVVIGLISGGIGAIFMFIYLTYINPELMDYISEKAMAGMREGMKEQKMPEEKMESIVAASKMMFSAPMQAIFMFLGQTVIGLVLSLIIAAFTRTKEPEPTVGM
jgi:hypothetical protein